MIRSRNAALQSRAFPATNVFGCYDSFVGPPFRKPDGRDVSLLIKPNNSICLTFLLMPNRSRGKYRKTSYIKKRFESSSMIVIQVFQLGGPHGKRHRRASRGCTRHFIDSKSIGVIMYWLARVRLVIKSHAFLWGSIFSPQDIGGGDEFATRQLRVVLKPGTCLLSQGWVSWMMRTPGFWKFMGTRQRTYYDTRIRIPISIRLPYLANRW